MAEAAAVYPWQLPVWQLLTARERHPHAFLFSGQAGLGKRQFAEAFADWLLCVQPDGGRACGQCRSCQLNTARSHPDRLVVEPESEGKVIRIDTVRELTDFILISQPSVSRMVDRLATRGLVERRAAPDDGRGVVVALTEEGARLQREIGRHHVRSIRRYVGGALDEHELRTLQHLAHKLRSAQREL